MNLRAAGKENCVNKIPVFEKGEFQQPEQEQLKNDKNQFVFGANKKATDNTTV